MSRSYVGILSLCLILLSTIPITTSMTISTAAAKAITSTSSSQFKVAIIGGGVAGCASARRLAQLVPSAQITCDPAEKMGLKFVYGKFDIFEVEWLKIIPLSCCCYYILLSIYLFH